MKNLLAATLFAVTVPLAPAGAGAVEPPSATAFFKRAAVRAPKLSPSGRFLAIQAAGKGDRIGLAVLDLQTMQPPKFIAGFNDADIATQHWISEDRLVFDVSDSPDGTTRVNGQGLWAVDRDGGNFRQLIKTDKPFVTTATLIADRRLDVNWMLHSVPSALDGSEVMVLRRPWMNESAGTGVQLARLDTRTGLTRTLSEGIPDHSGHWLLDWRGDPRVIDTLSQGRSRLYRRDEAGRWTFWFDDDPEAREHPWPLWWGPDGLMLGVQGYRGYAAVFRLDPASGRADGEPLVSTPGYDFTGSFITEPASGRLLGVRFETDAPGTVWLDKTMKAHQAAIDARLPGSVNLIECLRCMQASHLVVTSLSDRRPPLYFLYETAQKQLQSLAGTRPDLPAAAMGQRDYHRIAARDGLELPVLVTQPAGGLKGPAPTVVLVHGGPYVRGTHWAWSRDAQFLASRGYLVLEPEFRGSTGYGFGHFQAGWKQWGLAMQDDLADTLAWAVKRGWADPKRACIMGASYGGYAALMGAVRRPELYKAVVSIAGDADLIESLAFSRKEDGPDSPAYAYWRASMGDPKADEALLARASPARRAGEIQAPVLLIHGLEDTIVDPRQSKMMARALKAAGKTCELVELKGEGHRNWSDATWKTVLTTSTDFIAKYV